MVTVRIDREVSNDPVKTKRRMELFQNARFLINAIRKYDNSGTIFDALELCSANFFLSIDSVKK